MNCLIYLGDLPMDITWLFNGAHINAYTGVSIVKGGKKASILTIDSVHAGHAGNYTCKARNDADSAEYTAELIVNGIVGVFFFITESYVSYSFEYNLNPSTSFNSH